MIEDRGGNRLGTHGPVGKNGVNVTRIGKKFTHPRAHRSQLIHRQLSQRRLEITKAAAAEFGQHPVHIAAGKGGEDSDKVLRLGPAVQAGGFRRQRVRVRLRLADFLRDEIAVIRHVDPRIVGGVGLAHLRIAVSKAHHPRRTAENLWLGQREEFHAISLVEGLRDVACQLQMLFLVLADRHMRRAVGQNVGRHQGWIGIEADRRVLAVLACFFLELCHPVQPAKPRDAVEHPGQL